ncbi:MAG TPA: DNA alkylation repair protein [Candidatus Bathyarchaeia archaeon]|nr:DNA alkylation repair protein [Candidatus Bathyarchaeia archaeon]
MKRQASEKWLQHREHTAENVIAQLRNLGDPKALSGMARYGIHTSKAFGVPLPKIRSLARKVGKSHALAEALWKTGIREARILAGMIDEPTHVTQDQMERWVSDFDSWDVVDGVCGSLFDKTLFAVLKAHEWSTRSEEYVKRAGFVLMAELAVHDKHAANKVFLDFLPVIIREASDDRNFVKKAVNWALRQIGKRNIALNKAAIRTARTIQKIDSKAAKWIATDALRELRSDSVQQKLGVRAYHLTGR